jgi:hypothetical protein
MELLAVLLFVGCMTAASLSFLWYTAMSAVFAGEWKCYYCDNVADARYCCEYHCEGYKCSSLDKPVEWCPNNDANHCSACCEDYAMEHMKGPRSAVKIRCATHWHIWHNPHIATQ